VLCGNCESLASLWCDGCSNGTFYCSECFRSVHSIKALSQHKAISLQEKAKRPSFSTCSKHFKENEYYCADEKQFLCHVCLVDDHKMHNTNSAYKYAEKIREELKECLSPFKQKPVLETDEGKTIAQKKFYEEQLVKLKQSIKDIEEKLTKTENNLKEIKEKRSQIDNAQLVLSKSIEDMSITDLLNTETVNLFKRRIQDIIQLFPLPSSRKCIQKTLSGNPYISYGIGGIVFTMNALNPIQVTSLALTTRLTGNHSIIIKRINGKTSVEEKDKNSWPIILPKTTISFSSHTPTVVWKGELSLEQNQSVSWAISNYGNDNAGEIVASRYETKSVVDNNLEISTCAFLDRSREFVLYPAPEYWSQGFIGNVEYLAES